MVRISPGTAATAFAVRTSDVCDNAAGVLAAGARRSDISHRWTLHDRAAVPFPRRWRSLGAGSRWLW